MSRQWLRLSLVRGHRGRRFYLPDKRLRKLPREEIGAAMLWHQTFYQFTTLKDRQLMRPFPKPTNIQEPKREDDQWLREWFYDEERENYDWSLESGHTEEEDDAECAREEQFERERLALLIEKAEKDPEIQFRLGKYYQAKEKDELYPEAAKWLLRALDKGFWCYEELYYVHQKLGIELKKK